MGIAALDLIKRAAQIAQDESYVRWTEPEWLRWINDAAAAAIIIRPAARAVTNVLSLVQGTLQKLPGSAVQLLDVTRNMAADGVTPGRIVRRVDRQLLDDQNPDWHSTTPASKIKHYTFEERAPKQFYCYPPAIAGTKVEALYSELPPTVAQDSDTLDMGPEYLNALVNYMLYRALSKDSEYANGQIAAGFYQAFIDAINGGAAQTTANSPNQNSV